MRKVVVALVPIVFIGVIIWLNRDMATGRAEREWINRYGEITIGTVKGTAIINSVARVTFFFYVDGVRYSANSAITRRGFRRGEE